MNGNIQQNDILKSGIKVRNNVARDSAGWFCRLKEIMERDYAFTSKLVRRVFPLLYRFGINNGLRDCNLHSRIKIKNIWFCELVRGLHSNGTCGLVNND